MGDTSCGIEAVGSQPYIKQELIKRKAHHEHT